MSSLHLIRTVKDIESLAGLLEAADFIAVDCETTGLTKSDQVIGLSFCCNESEAHYIVLAEWSTADSKLVDLGLYDAAKALLERIKGRSLIMHNGTFDCIMIEAFFKVSLIESLHTDTLILAHLLNENRKNGLKELAKQYFGDSSTKEAEEMKASVEANGGSVTKDTYEMFKADSSILGKYGAQDALLTYKLFYILVDDLYEQGLDKFFYEEESMPLLRGPTYELNNTGLRMDQGAVNTLKKTLQAECLEAKAFIMSEISAHIAERFPGTNKKNTFNLGSNYQLAWLLFGKLELEFGTLTDGGKDVCYRMLGKLPYTAAEKRAFIATCIATIGHIYEAEVKTPTKTIRAKKVREPWYYTAVDNKTLGKLAPKYQWIAKLLEYQKKTKILNTYVIGFEERTRYGVVNPSFLQHGTTSGRYASRGPNLQNLPRDDKRVKGCIVPRPGNVFVGADYSQLEPRVFAYFSKDSRLLAAFDGTNDFYSVIGMEVFGKKDCTPQKEGSPDAFGVKYKKLRDLAKVIALASVYGATPNQLMSTTGKTREETKKDMDAYFRRFPGVLGLMEESHNIAKTTGRVSNLFGRLRRIPEAKNIDAGAKHTDLPYEARKLLNLSTNHRIQSTAASIVNRSAIRFCELKKEHNIECKIVVQVHDSLVVECREEDAETVSLLLQGAMENTVHLEGIALEAIPQIGNNLSKV